MSDEETPPAPAAATSSPAANMVTEAEHLLSQLTPSDAALGDIVQLLGTGLVFIQADASEPAMLEWLRATLAALLDAQPDTPVLQRLRDELSTSTTLAEALHTIVPHLPAFPNPNRTLLAPAAQAIRTAVEADPDQIPPDVAEDIRKVLTPILQRQLPDIPQAFDAQGLGRVSSGVPISAVLSAIAAAAAGKGWDQDDPEHNTPGQKWPIHRYENSKGATVYVTMRPPETSETPRHAEPLPPSLTTASLWERVRSMTDLDGDVLLAFMAQEFADGGTRGDLHWFQVPAFLDYRGIQKIKGTDGYGHGHRVEDLDEVAAAIERLSGIWIEYSNVAGWENMPPMGKGRRKKPVLFKHSGRLLLIAETIRQRDLIPDPSARTAERIMAVRFRMGTWLDQFIERPNRQTAYLLQSALRYDPHNEKWEKRLARYFMIHLRINSKGEGGMIRRRVGALLDELHLDVDPRNPIRTKDRFKKAMDRLVADGHLAHWDYKPGQAREGARGWLPTWLESYVDAFIHPLIQSRYDEDRRAGARATVAAETPPALAPAPKPRANRQTERKAKHTAQGRNRDE